MTPDQATFLIESARFVCGQWTLERPTKPGTYLIAARGTQVGASSQTNVLYEDPRTNEVCWVTPWGGWWWSEPLPTLPQTPDWAGKE